MQCAPSNYPRESLIILIVQEDNDRKRGGNLVAWEIVMKPKEKGGLGVLNLRLQNDALLMKHLNKFYNRANIIQPRCPMQLGNQDPSGGRMYSGLIPFLEV